MQKSDYLKALSDRLDNIARFSIWILMTVMVIVVIFGVLNRFLFKFSISWTEEVARYSLIWITILGSGCAMKSGGHIGITLFMNRAGKLKKIFFLIGNVLILLFLAVTVIYGIKLCISQYGQISPALRISMSYPFFGIPLGCSIMIIHLIHMTRLMLRDTVVE